MGGRGGGGDGGGPQWNKSSLLGMRKLFGDTLASAKGCSTEAVMGK